jgi:capsular exopolysaccharide synthesis family protein
MDRLSKALVKARADRDFGLPTAGAPGSALGSEGGRPIFGDLPEPRLRQMDPDYVEAHRVLTESENGPALHAFKLLRTQVMERMRSNGWKTLVVTSPTQGNGKTVTAINLAINLARHAHQNVLLMDLDLRKPSIREYLSNEPGPGISDYIFGDADLEEIMFNPGIRGLTVIPGREALSDSSEALLHQKTVRLLNDLRARYAGGSIILDMPPVLAVDDVMAFASHWDAFLLIVEEGRTTESEVEKSLELLRGKPLAGTVLTKSHDVLPDYGY